MERVKIQDLCTFLPKSKIKAGEGLEKGDYIFFTSSDIKTLKLNNYLFDDEALILGTGGKPSCNYYKGKFAVSTDNFVLTSDKVKIKYLYYFLRHNNLYILENGFHGAGLKHISKDYVNDIVVPIVDDNTQDLIIDNLDSINQNIQFCKSQLIKYDEIVKSQFIEMFGDVLSNTKNFEMCCFGDYVNQMNIGPFGSDLKNEDFVPEEDGYCMVYEQKHAIQKNMALECRYVDELKYNKLKRFDIGPGDIIVSCRGTIGECFVLPNDAPNGIIHPSLMMIKPKNIVNNRFLVFLLEHILEEQTEQGSGVKMAIKATELSKIKTIKPERNLQDQFINFVQQIDKSKYSGGVMYA